MGFSKRTVALKYDFKSDCAPKIIAKGWGTDGKLIEETALKNGVPIEKNEDLAKTLYQLPVLSEIPEALYEIIAVIYIELQKVNNSLQTELD